ncbi:MAK10-like protein [Tanacetum coccineum]
MKYMNALIDQGFDVNVMPMSFYSRSTDKEHVGTDVRLYLASHSYTYPLGIAEDVLIDIAGYLYPVDFVILDITEDRNKSFILGTSFLTTAKAVISFEKGTTTLKSRKNRIDFIKVPALPSELEKNAKDDLDPITREEYAMLGIKWEKSLLILQCYMDSDKYLEGQSMERPLKSLALKAKKESSYEECSTFGSEYEEYAMLGIKC